MDGSVLDGTLDIKQGHLRAPGDIETKHSKQNQYLCEYPPDIPNRYKDAML